MRYCFFVVFACLFSGNAFAASFSDLQAAILRQEYQQSREIAEELLGTKQSRRERQETEYYLGLSQLRLGEYARAQETFVKLLSDRPDPDLYDKTAVGRIDTLTLQGFYEKALKEANHLIATRKRSEMLSLFYLKSARANLKLAQWAKAQALLRKITDEYPGTFESDAARQLLEEKQYFTVQIGSFAEKLRAQALVSELTAQGEYAFMVESRKKDGRTMYRVRVGQLAALKEAQALEAKLAKLGYSTLIYP